MGVACATHEADNKIYKMFEKLKGGDSFNDLFLEGRIILKRMLIKFI
jgi:predicted CopG family antitoxin